MCCEEVLWGSSWQIHPTGNMAWVDMGLGESQVSALPDTGCIVIQSPCTLTLHWYLDFFHIKVTVHSL